jgi:long-chain fatty acid transport protein
MKLNKLLLALAASGIATSAFATNDDTLIGLGAQSRALGGTGAAAFFGSENALTNPALLAKSKGTEFAFGGTVFMPDVEASTNVSGVQASQTSEADLSLIPEVSLSNRINDNWTLGIGMFGTAGMGVDYRDTDALFNGYTNLQLMKFAPTAAYNSGNFGFGFAPVIQYGALDINYTDPFGNNTGDGVSSDIGFGFNLGAYWDVTPNLTLGAAYQSAIDMEYDGQITTAAGGFGLAGFTDHLEQPGEFKVGVAYTTGPWMFTGDYKLIQWSSAKGYEDFNWDDQDVFALGVKYTGKGYWVGVGYNYGEDPIKKLPSEQSMTGYSNQAVNLFNNHFFPAVVESHFTAGGGFSIGKNSMVDMALVYADEVSKTVNTGTISSVLGAGDPTVLPVDFTSHTVTHSQLGFTVSVRMNF